MKYIIEIEDKPFDVQCQLYRAKGFSNLVFNRIDLERLTKYNPTGIGDNMIEIGRQLNSIADSLSGIKIILNNSNRSIL